jgi:hypothetical protein
MGAVAAFVGVAIAATIPRRRPGDTQALPATTAVEAA